MTDKIAIQCTSEDLKKIDKIISDVTAQFINDLPRLVKHRLDSATAEIMGFRQSITRNGKSTEWDLYPFDAKGQAVPLKEMVVQKAQDKAKIAIQNIKFEYTPTMIAAMEQVFNDEFGRIVRYGIQELARKKAEEALAKASTMEGDIEFAIPKLVRSSSVKNMSDPSFGSKCPIEKALMKDTVKFPGKEK